MSALLLSLVDNLSDGLHTKKCADCKSSLEYMKVDGAQLIFKCLSCNKNFSEDFDKDLISRFSSTYNFCKRDTNQFILLLREAVYPYEYMTD